MIDPKLQNQLMLIAEHYAILWYTMDGDKVVYVVWSNDDPSGEPFREVIVDNSTAGVEILHQEFPIPTR
jgi:hypothetical protein